MKERPVAVPTYAMPPCVGSGQIAVAEIPCPSAVIGNVVPDASFQEMFEELVAFAFFVRYGLSAPTIMIAELRGSMAIGAMKSEPCTSWRGSGGPVHSAALTLIFCCPTSDQSGPSFRLHSVLPLLVRFRHR